MDIYSVIHVGGPAPYVVVGHRPDGTAYRAAGPYRSRIAADAMRESLYLWGGFPPADPGPATCEHEAGEPAYCATCWAILAGSDRGTVTPANADDTGRGERS